MIKISECFRAYIIVSKIKLVRLIQREYWGMCWLIQEEKWNIVEME